MGNTYTDKHMGDHSKGDSFYSSSKSRKSAAHNALYISDSKAWTLVKGGKPGRTLILQLIESETCENWFHELFLKRSRGLGIGIPKHLISLDEKYVRRCLELMHINASKGAPFALSVNSNSSDSGFMSDYATVTARNSLDAAKNSIDYPMAVGTRDIDISPVDEGIVGSVMGSDSMKNILNSPLFQRLRVSNDDARLERTNLFENKRCFPSNFPGSPDHLTSTSSHDLGKETLALKDHGYRYDSVQTSPISMSSGLSLLTDQSFTSSSYLSDSQGMLQCTWDGGNLHFSFALDDQKELYVAKAWKVEVTDDKGLDYVYSFHLKPSGQKMFDISDNESNLIGKMKVSTAFSQCSCNLKVMESKFVLVSANTDHAREVNVLTRNSRRSRKLSKVMEVFKTGHSLKQPALSIFGGSNAIPEDISSEKGLEACCSADQQCQSDLSENDFIPNLEMAAIVVKGHVQDEDHRKEVPGGWGLKFLDKSGVKQNVDSLDAPTSSECCLRNVGNCSTSMDIIVPAGPHGGPKTRNGGPTGLIERWQLGGQCDCGGWDIGCPLKVLKARPRGEKSRPSSGDCKSFNMFTEGSKQGTPTLKMVNIHEGSYLISFQSSSLSALQCFAIAVAIIHSQNPTLQRKGLQN